MAARYYEREHFEAYARIKGEGLDQWNDLYADDRTGYDDFQTRDFLDRVLDRDGRGRPLLEYGCGTGAAACFLAEREYRVHAIDLVPDAIDLAREHARRRGLPIRFDVDDVCRWQEPTEYYDVIIDSFCLQSVVTDDDRARLLTGVGKRLNPGGHYLISTAMFSPDRDYGDDHYDEQTGIVWTPSPDPGADRVVLDGSWHAPNRRHLTAGRLRAELLDHGFRVIEQFGPLGGEIVCGR